MMESESSLSIGSGPTVSVLLIDPHALTRRCIASLLASADRGIRVSACAKWAKGGATALENFDLVLWNLHSMRITEASAALDLRAIRQSLPDVPLVVLSKHDDPAHAQDAIRLGARGHIPATLGLPIIVAACRLILAGGSYVAPVDSETEANAIPNTTVEAATDFEANSRKEKPAYGLTNREEEVLALLRQGKPNKLIAHELLMSENTVKVHVRRIIKKLKVINRTAAAFADKA